MKNEFIVCVGGTWGNGWLTLPSDEDDALDIVITSDPELVLRYETSELAEAHLNKLVAAHPKREFCVREIEPLKKTSPFASAVEEAAILILKDQCVLPRSDLVPQLCTHLGVHYRIPNIDLEVRSVIGKLVSKGVLKFFIARNTEGRQKYLIAMQDVTIDSAA